MECLRLLVSKVPLSYGPIVLLSHSRLIPNRIGQPGLDEAP
jgi:hypothetical protein